eukprot:scaffold81061_cov58-Attheya_sp.AAC.3
MDPLANCWARGLDPTKAYPADDCTAAKPTRTVNTFLHMMIMGLRRCGFLSHCCVQQSETITPKDEKASTEIKKNLDVSDVSANDDAFAALSSKGKKKKGVVMAKKKKSTKEVTPIVESSTATSTATPTGTSSETPTDTATATAIAVETKNALTKQRHHGTSDARKAKLDALLQELQETKQQEPSSYYGPGGSGSGSGSNSHSRPLEKMGSYVEPGEEHLTTNVFVGNLHPSNTEEELTDLFRQFGETLLNIHNSIPSNYLLEFRRRLSLSSSRESCIQNIW